MAVFSAVFFFLMAALVTGQHVEIIPARAVLRAGESLTVMCKVPYKIDSCRFSVGSQSYRLSPGVQEGEVIYSGQGLEAGECGAEFKRVKEEWNGNITCNLPPPTGAGIEATSTMQLIIAKAPGEPQLLSPPQAAFNEGDHFVAQCVVPNGRPAAKITWYLGTEQLFAGVHQPTVKSEPGSDLETIIQNFTRTLAADDDGQLLECKSEHEALSQPLSSKRQLVVHYAPKREAGTLTIFGLKLGSEGRLNVTVRANPGPRAVWQVADAQLTAPAASEDRALVALEPQLLGNGKYNITLLLSRIAKEDVDRTYYLTVSNELGTEQIPVRISTLDEPAGMELGAGAIVGIIVGVLVVLVAISLAVFAFATNRWCFAGRRRDTNKSSGESAAAGDVLLESGNTLPRNDTESAVGGRERSRLAGLGARVLAALPRGKDRVQAADSQPADTEDKPLSEEKKGVVYAELVLGDQAATEKPPPPATEYAEIVYTEQPKEEKKDTPQ